MSEAVVKSITGVCEEISEKNGWVQFAIDVGSQYPVRVSTKLPALIEQGRAAGSELATWTYKESEGKENPNRPGTFFSNRYLEKVETGGQNPNPPAPAQTSLPASGNQPPAHSPLLGGDKDVAITRMACLKAACELLRLSDKAPDDLALDAIKVAARFEVWVYRDISEVPFA